MAVSQQEARDALQEIAHTHDRAKVLQGYATAAPHFFIWGAVWGVGYVVSALSPPASAWIWWILIVLGCFGDVVVARRQRRSDDYRLTWRYPAAFVIFVIFVFATYYILGVVPNDLRPHATFPPLIVATAYCLAGLWFGRRFLVAGMLFAALTLGGFAFLKDTTLFLFWMAFLGGGSLILVGVWLRRV